MPRVEILKEIVERIIIKDGIPVLTLEEADRAVPVTEPRPLVNEAGEVVLDEDGKIRVIHVPVFDVAEEPYTEMVESQSYRLGLRAEQMLWGIIASLGDEPLRLSGGAS